MLNRKAPITLPHLKVSQFLTATAEPVPDAVHRRMLSLFVASRAVFALGGIVLTFVIAGGYLRLGTPGFGWLLVADVFFWGVRLAVWDVTKERVRRGEPTPTDVILAVTLIWAGMVGLTAAVCFASGDPTMQLFGLNTMLGIFASIVARNNTIPRMAMVMMVLVGAPVNGAILLFGEPILYLIPVQFVAMLYILSGTVWQMHKSLLGALMAERESEANAQSDQLTGLLNRRGLFARLDDMLPVSQQDRFAMIYLDMDGFKQVNDGYGHAVGDMVLEVSAMRMAECLPEDAIIARIGGDEFIVVLDDTDSDEAAMLAEALVTECGRPIEGEGSVSALTGVSAGLAMAEPGETADQLMHRADAALYAAKRQGRGIVAVADARQSAPPTKRLRRA